MIVDDATTNILYARLFERDGSLPNIQVLDYVFRKYGLPLAIYTDKASWFHYSEQGVKVQNTFKAGGDGFRYNQCFAGDKHYFSILFWTFFIKI